MTTHKNLILKCLSICFFIILIFYQTICQSCDLQRDQECPPQYIVQSNAQQADHLIQSATKSAHILTKDQLLGQLCVLPEDIIISEIVTHLPFKDCHTLVSVNLYFYCLIAGYDYHVLNCLSSQNRLPKGFYPPENWGAFKRICPSQTITFTNSVTVPEHLAHPNTVHMISSRLFYREIGTIYNPPSHLWKHLNATAVHILNLSGYQTMNQKQDIMVLSDLCCALSDNHMLKALILNDYNFDTSGTQQFAEFLQSSKSLQHFTLRSCTMNNENFETLSVGLSLNKSVQSLSFSYINFDDNFFDLKTVVQINTTLTYIDLHSNHMDDVRAIALAHAIKKNQILKVLNLMCNDMGICGVLHIVKSIKNTRICKVDMRCNSRLNPLDPAYGKIHALVAKYKENGKDILL